MKCQQCGKPAVITYDEGRINLCIDCNLKFQQAQEMEFRRIAQIMNHLGEEIEMGLGISGIVPRYKIPQPIYHQGNTTFNNINVRDSNIGSINTGYVKSIDVSLSVINKQRNDNSTRLLKTLTEEILRHNEFDEKNKNEILEQLAFVSEELAKPIEQQKKSILKSTYNVLSNLLSNSANLLEIWKALEEIIK